MFCRRVGGARFLRACGVRPACLVGVRVCGRALGGCVAACVGVAWFRARERALFEREIR